MWKLLEGIVLVYTFDTISYTPYFVCMYMIQGFWRCIYISYVQGSAVQQQYRPASKKPTKLLLYIEVEIDCAIYIFIILQESEVWLRFLCVGTENIISLATYRTAVSYLWYEVLKPDLCGASR